MPHSSLDALFDFVDSVSDADDELSLEVTRAESQRRSITMNLHIRTQTTQPCVWEITCYGMLEHRLTLGEVDELELNGDHPLLLEHLDRHASLHYVGTLSDPTQALGRLAEVTQTMMGDWRPMSRYIRPDTSWLLAQPSGLLARGPVSLLKEYGRALEPLAVQTRLLGEGPAQHWDGPLMGWRPTDPGVKVLVLMGGEPASPSSFHAIHHSYIVAEAFGAYKRAG